RYRPTAWTGALGAPDSVARGWTAAMVVRVLVHLPIVMWGSRHDRPERRHRAIRGPEAGYLRSAQAGRGVPAAELPGELRPVGVRCARGLPGQGARRRRR